jgi:hypothetical protein
VITGLEKVARASSQNFTGLLLPVSSSSWSSSSTTAGSWATTNGRVGNVLAWSAVSLVIALDVVLLGVTALGIVRIRVG